MERKMTSKQFSHLRDQLINKSRRIVINDTTEGKLRNSKGLELSKVSDDLTSNLLDSLSKEELIETVMNICSHDKKVSIWSVKDIIEITAPEKHAMIMLKWRNARIAYDEASAPVEVMEETLVGKVELRLLNYTLGRVGSKEKVEALIDATTFAGLQIA